MSLTTAPFDMTTYPWARTQSATAREATPPLLRFGIWTTFIITCVWLGLALAQTDIAMLFGRLTPFLVAVFGFGLLVVLMRRQNAVLLTHINASALRAGPWHADITDEGLVMRGAGARTLFLWGALTAVRENQYGLMIMMGPGSFVPIARAAFASDADREAFRTALNARISGHRGAA